jgi:CHAD domain-containing protein
MAHLDRDHAGLHSMQRIFSEQLEEAVALLSRKRVTDGQVHEARKQLKKARATLRLLRDALGEAAYARENGALRDAARPLSSVRDARVLPEALEQLTSSYGRAGGALPIARLRGELTREHARERKRVTRSQVSALAANVVAAQRRSARWRVSGGWTVLGAGFARTYRRGREAYAVARSRTTADLHEWRKQVKYLRYQFHLLEPLWPAIIGELADQAHALTEYLGEDHDLAVLQQRIQDGGEKQLDGQTRGALLALIERCRRRLQDKAFVLGQRLYEERPAQLRRRFGQYWRTWREDSAPATK